MEATSMRLILDQNGVATDVSVRSTAAVFYLIATKIAIDWSNIARMNNMPHGA
jgi:hypothetical protein